MQFQNTTYILTQDKMIIITNGFRIIIMLYNQIIILTSNRNNKIFELKVEILLKLRLQKI